MLTRTVVFSAALYSEHLRAPTLILGAGVFYVAHAVYDMVVIFANTGEDKITINKQLNIKEPSSNTYSILETSKMTDATQHASFLLLFCCSVCPSSHDFRGLRLLPSLLAC